MSDTTSRNKRIAKNTMMLYIRMLFSMTVSLYTSRVVLSTLGVDDFGIYGLVGGVVALFSFLNASMSGATSRFLTFEMGRGDSCRLKETFDSAVIVHIGIALLVFILAETVGLWFLENKLVIPPERMYAARWVYQLSIASMIVTVIQVPYNATLIAHERMNVYACTEIANTSLKLAIVYLLVIGRFDKLILYAALMLAVSLVIALTYRIYCLKNFEESRFKWSWNPGILRPMLLFSGWDLYGNLSITARSQGINMLLNMFFGVLLNAAYTVANQVQYALLAFGNNIIMAVRPQIVKSYAVQNYRDTVELVLNTAKYTYLLLLVLSLPLALEMDFVLRIWLPEVPPYAVVFCRLALLGNLFTIMVTTINCAVHATGRIKRLSLINGTLYLAVLPISYIAFKWWNGAPEIPYICNVLFVFIGLLFSVQTLRSYLPEFPVKAFIVKVLGVCGVISAVSFAISCCVKNSLPEGFIRLFLVACVSTLITVAMTWFLATDKQTKQSLKTKLSRIKCRKSR